MLGISSVQYFFACRIVCRSIWARLVLGGPVSYVLLVFTLASAARVLLPVSCN